MNRSACRVLLSLLRPEFCQCRSGGVGGILANVPFEAPSSPELQQQLIIYLGEDAWTLLKRFFSTSILAIHLLEHDDEALRSGSSTKPYDDVKFQSTATAGDGTGASAHKWMLLVEFSDAFDAPFASYKEKCGEFGEGFIACGVDLGKLKEEIYGFVVVMEE